MATVEKRIITGCSLRAMSEGDEMSLVGYAARYGVLSHLLPFPGGRDNFREVIQRGAFKRAIAEKQDVVATFNHSADAIPLGRTRSGTLNLSEDDKGLKFRCQLDPRQSAHRDLHASVRRRDVQDCSFAFTVPQNGDSWDANGRDDDGNQCILRTLKDVDLKDVSVVCQPAYPQTSVDARSLAHYSVTSEDAALRAKAAAYANQIRMDYITDPSCKAVVLRNGVFHRDFAREGELKSVDLLFEAGPDAVIRELNKRAGVSFEAEPMRDGELDARPGATPDPLSLACDASDSAAHRKAAEAHRAAARKAKTLDAGVEHFKAADAHDKAAQTGNPVDSSAARAASKKLRSY